METNVSNETDDPPEKIIFDFNSTDVRDHIIMGSDDQWRVSLVRDGHTMSRVIIQSANDLKQVYLSSAIPATQIGLASSNDKLSLPTLYFPSREIVDLGEGSFAECMTITFHPSGEYSVDGTGKQYWIDRWERVCDHTFIPTTTLALRNPDKEHITSNPHTLKRRSEIGLKESLVVFQLMKCSQCQQEQWQSREVLK